MAALIREAKEEVGVVIESHEATNLEPDKCSGPRWFPLGGLPDHLIPYCRAALGYISNNQCFSTFGW